MLISHYCCLSVSLVFLHFLLCVFQYDVIWQILFLYLREIFFPLKALYTFVNFT